MSKNFSYILSQFKLDAMTFCNMNTNYFYDVIKDHNQEGLGKFAKDVLYNIENECRTSFLIKDELISLLSVLCTQ